MFYTIGVRKKLILFSFFAAFVLLPLTAFAQAQTDPSQLLSGDGGGLVPGTATSQAGGAYYKACDLVTLANNVINFGVAFSVVVATLMFVYAGILYVTAASNPEQVQKAHKVFGNIFFGLVLVLLAWLIINILLSVLTGKAAGEWSHISCISNPTSAAFADKPDVAAMKTSSIVGGGASSGGGASLASTRALCTPANLIANGMSSAIATRMSCVTRFENSSCTRNQPSLTDVGADGRSVSFGMFQINISAHDLNQYPQCRAVVNNANLNCPAAFQGGAYTARNHSTRVSNENLYNTCISAVSNPQCNIAVAEDTYNHGGIGQWGTDAQRGCGG